MAAPGLLAASGLGPLRRALWVLMAPGNTSHRDSRAGGECWVAQLRTTHQPSREGAEENKNVAFFLALVGHRGKREGGWGMAPVTAGHSACELSWGSVRTWKQMC